MSNPEADYLAQTLHKANALKALLNSEFRSLKEQDLQSFEELQQQKIEILDFLGSEELLERISVDADENTVRLGDGGNLLDKRLKFSG